MSMNKKMAKNALIVSLGFLTVSLSGADIDSNRQTKAAPDMCGYFHVIDGAYDLLSNPASEEPKLQINNEKNREALYSKFLSAYLNPFHTADIIDVLDDLEIDTVEVANRYKNIKKPKVMYSSLSLYEKSFYSLNELKKMKKMEEEYLLKKKKMAEIARRTRMYSPFRNKHVQELFYYGILFSESPAHDKRIATIFAENNELFVKSIFFPKTYFQLGVLKKLYQDGIFGTEEDSSIMGGSLSLDANTVNALKIRMAEEKIKESGFNPDSYSSRAEYMVQRAIYNLLFNGMLPSYSEEDRAAMEKFYESVIEKTCGGGKNRMLVMKPSTAIFLSLMALEMSEKEKRIYDFYQLYYNREAKLFEWFRMWVFDTIKKHDPSYRYIYPLMEDRKSLKRFQKKIADEIKSVYDIGEYFDAWALSKKFLDIWAANDIVALEDPVKTIKKVFGRSSLQVQRVYTKKKDPASAMAIYKTSRNYLSKSGKVYSEAKGETQKGKGGEGGEKAISVD